MSVSGERLALSALGETSVVLPDLASDRSQLQIEFVGLSFVSGEEIRYQYKLENTDRDWTLPFEAHSVNYAHLAPGTYTFLVRAVNSDGVVSEKPASVKFTILAPIWRRWWFTVLIAFVGGALAFVVYRYRVQRLIELERVRTSIATDLHDDIGANLTRIAILSEVAQQRLGHLPNNGDDLLPSIAKISRESISSMGDIVWAINPNKDTLEDLIRRMRDHAREILERRDITLRFSTSESTQAMKLNANTRRGIYLIFKEALNNVVRHSRTPIVYVELKINDAELFLSIKDEGAGYDMALDYDGNGLLSMKKRAADLKAKLEMDSAVGQGTRIYLRVPL
jgi:signal transduction histidine kinase